MATPRDIRRLALMALYQLDVRSEEDLESIRASLDDPESLADEGQAWADPKEPFTKRDTDRAFDLALGAFRMREATDRAMEEIAPEWPAHRQAAVDRAILRLAHYEMTAGLAPPKAVVNEAVEMAKDFSTEKSPQFINALLDKILKRVLASSEGV